MLRVGIIGLGVGEAHIAGYQSHPECEVVALCDFAPDKVKMAREKYPKMHVCENADEILSDPSINVVSVASFENYHTEQIVTAVKNKKHVFGEKPLCTSEKEALQIRQVFAENPEICLSSNHILRKSPRFIELRQMIAKGVLGELSYVEGDYNYGRVHKLTDGWRGEIPFYSVVYGGGIHLVDLILWLTGDRVVEVAAFGNNVHTKGSAFRYNDTVTSILKFESGMVGKVASNFGCVYPHFHVLNVYGTKATFVNGQDTGHLYESRDPKVPPQKISTEYPGAQKGDLIRSFIEEILGGPAAEVTAEDIFQALSVCFAIEKAAEEGRCVAVNYI